MLATVTVRVLSVSPAGAGSIPSAPALDVRPWVRRALLLASLVVVVGTVALEGYQWFRTTVIRTNPSAVVVNVDAVLHPRTDVTVLVAAGNDVAPWTTTTRELVSSPVLWRRMHLMQWNLVPDPFRTEALDNMLAVYRPLLTNPAVWDRMSPHDWDGVPQPVRVIAFRHMLDYWAGFYALGDAYELPRWRVADMLAAVVMTESWFDHRADVTGVHGNRDVGLGQASDYARSRLRALYQAGVVDANLTDDDYLNPWAATRFVALWMQLMLDEAHGDLDTAVRAYHRGITAAHDRLGTVYVETVRQRLARYIRNHDAPVAWAYVWARGQQLEREDWPWLAAPESPQRRATETPR
jgi:hypothetical protein